jgi:prevent-host-death family protein
MSVVGMHQAKTRLSELVHEVEAGGDVVITRHGHPVVRLTLIQPPNPRRGLGAMKGRGSVESLAWDEVLAGDDEIAATFAAALKT